jgi:hypothetical protein
MKQKTEMRKHRREKREEMLFVEVVSASNSKASDNLILECRTRDISANGLNIRADYPINADAILELAVNFESSKQQFLLTAQVKWSKQLAEQHFVIGFELIDSEHSDYSQWQKLFEPER